MAEDTTVTSNTSTTSSKKPEIKVVEIPAGMRAEIFHFRKEKVKDDEGNDIGDAYKHPSIMVPLPVATKEELAAIFNAPSEGEGSRASEQKWIIDLIHDAFYGQAREQINAFREESPKAECSAQVLDYSKISITALANMPASERGNKISDEDMKDFIENYVSIMPAATGKDVTKIKKQAKLLQAGLRTVKTEKKVLELFDNLLAVWASAAGDNLVEHQQVYDMLTGRIKKWLTATPKNLMADLF